jgi:hypothetical protein
MRLPRIVPWKSNEEWDYVYSCLYCTSSSIQQLGVDRVKAWRSRGKVPHSVDSTASFLEVQLHDLLHQSGKSQTSASQLQMMYTMVFVRFVNGIVDPAQKSQFAQSVSSLAEILGLPSWFVDLRHAGTHDSLPTLQLLRTGCEQVRLSLLILTLQALEWLNSNYWQVQKQHIPESVNEIRHVLKQWKEARKQEIKGISNFFILTQIHR